jgi:molybdenum cofactor cytidylyltransferase
VLLCLSAELILWQRLNLFIEKTVKQVEGLLLAAGKSQRMGSLKPLLRVFGRTFLEHVVSEARQSDLIGVKIILGHLADIILKSLPQFEADVVINPAYEQGQLSSLIQGLKAIQGHSIDGVMLFLVDHPFISRHVINKLLQSYSEHEQPIVIPTFRGRRGHPLIFGRELFSELINAPLDRGAVSVVKRHQEDILSIEVGDEGVLIDIDTPEAYQEYVVKAGKVGAAEETEEAG